MIEILMTTYNSEKYIEEQLNSILNQHFKNFHVTISDDSSSDRTMQIIQKYAKIFPEKISIIYDEAMIGSVCKSFSRLLQQCNAEYIAFCEQEDIWKKDKLLIEIKKIRQLEALHGKSTPILVHSDLEIIDDNFNINHKSFFKHNNLLSEPKLENLLIENSIKGGTCLFNNALLLLSKNMPGEVIMYDWWIALLAASFGKIGFVNLPLVSCREKSKEINSRKNSIRPLDFLKASIQYSYKQAEILLFQFSTNLPINKFEIIGEYACFLIETKSNKIKTIIYKGYKKRGFKKLISQIVFC